jgi:phage gpG-like protein
LYTRSGKRPDIARIVALASQAAVGQQQAEIARGIWLRVGMQLLSLIKDAFVVKAAGGVDAAGDSWPRLAKSTVAYSRRHPGVLWPGAKRAPFAPSWMLNKQQRERWWQLYRQFGGTAPAGRAYHAKGVNKGWAAARAWMVLKSEGAKTLMSEYGDMELQPLRSTGSLLNSLTPGVEPDQIVDGLTQPVTPKDEQVFRLLAGRVVVGTNRLWAGVHHNGSKDGRIPQRRLWPKPSKWPSSWWQLILSQALQGMIEAVTAIVQNDLV